ncbi:dihydroanticapsin 7-dehydrogenase [Brucella sp. NBRC 13694]|uniref:SDR family oxidoreductase n=1 Tax=Brucella sp. NBRC 13694 TaxID=3075482 RepID=UPI0028AED40C|nr:SDR family oxidoreductase [Brucella anthropi]
MRLRDKVAVITGGGAGIGAAEVELFVEEGAQVLVVDRNAHQARETAQRVGAESFGADISDETQVAAMTEAAQRLFGRVDILVNNAGYGIRGSVVTTQANDWDALMAVNLKGVFLCAKHIIPLMAASGGGAIVNTASNIAQVGIADRAAYVASKGGVAALTRAMALDHVALNIRVNAVAPGTTWSSYFDEIVARHDDPDGFVAALNARAPMNRMAQPREIAHAILWLASDDSSYATGSILTVDGGMTAW